MPNERGITVTGLKELPIIKQHFYHAQEHEYHETASGVHYTQLLLAKENHVTKSALKCIVSTLIFMPFDAYCSVVRK